MPLICALDGNFFEPGSRQDERFWEVDAGDFKGFRPIKEWADLLATHGFTQSGKALFQPNDPSDNALIRLIKN
jgi:hypothetical protein